MIKLREMRLARGMTQTDLAKAVRYADPAVDQTMISVLERGELYPSEKLRDALCEALGCSEAELYDGVEALFVPSAEREYSDTTRILEAVFANQSAKHISRNRLRQQIREWCGMIISDRTMRKWVEKARQEGMVIGNDQDGNGYYLPESASELEGIYRQNQHRAMAILAQQKHIRKRLKELG